MNWPFTLEGTALIIPVFATAIIGVINAIRGREIQLKQEVIEKKVDVAQEVNQQQQDVIVEKVDGVHNLTDGRLSMIEKKLAASEAKSELLLAQLRQIETTRLAQAVIDERRERENALALATTTSSATTSATTSFPPIQITVAEIPKAK